MTNENKEKQSGATAYHLFLILILLLLSEDVLLSLKHLLNIDQKPKMNFENTQKKGG